MNEVGLIAWILAGLVSGAVFLRFAMSGEADRERRVLAVGWWWLRWST